MVVGMVAAVFKHTRVPWFGHIDHGCDCIVVMVPTSCTVLSPVDALLFSIFTTAWDCYIYNYNVLW